MIALFPPGGISQIDLHQGRSTVSVFYTAVHIGSRRMWRNGFEKRLAGGAAQLLAKIIIACAILTGAMIGAASACSTDDDDVASSVVAVRQNAVELVPAIVSAGPIKTNGMPNRADEGCSGGCHCKTIGCGCCLASLASLSTTPNPFLPATSTRMLPFDQSEAPSARPPPDFRPPRIFI